MRNYLGSIHGNTTLLHQQKSSSYVSNCRHYIQATIIILHLHSDVCIYIQMYLEYHNCIIIVMSTIAYIGTALLLMFH
jgi:hypothetical protein